MFARSVSFQLKLGRAAQFARLLDNDIIPVLRTQKGFQDEVTFVASGGVDAVGISMWDLKEDADKYAHGAYPGVLKALAQVVEGTPEVTTYDGVQLDLPQACRSRDCPTPIVGSAPGSAARPLLPSTSPNPKS